VARLLNRRIQQVPQVGSRLTESRRALICNAGCEVLDLKPYPSRPLPPHMLEAAREAARQLVIPPSRGLSQFQCAVAAALRSELSIELDPERNVLATNGGMHALFVTFLAVLNPGDEVLVPSPCYFLEGIVEPLGGKITYVPMDETREYMWDFDLLEASITSHTKCLFLNTPVNPTGRVLSQDDLRRVAELADRHNLLLIADESYNTLVYDGRDHRSIVGLPLAQPRTLLIRSFTKSFAMPGWRVAFIAGPAVLIDALSKALEWTMLHGAYVNQVAATAALRGPQDWLAGVAEEFQSARDLICSQIRRSGAISAVTPAGGPFVFINVARLRRSSDEVAAILLEEFGVPTTPGRFLHSPEHIRMAFGATAELLTEAAERLARAVKAIGTQGN
jgi:aspartate/methionine/tyrosine aminotransferase